MIKVLVTCGNGVGSSLMLKMKADSVLKELGVDYTLDHFSLGEIKNKAGDYDYILVSNTFVNEFPNQDNIIGLENILSDEEIKEKLQAKMGA